MVATRSALSAGVLSAKQQALHGAAEVGRPPSANTAGPRPQPPRPAGGARVGGQHGIAALVVKVEMPMERLILFGRGSLLEVLVQGQDGVARIGSMCSNMDGSRTLGNKAGLSGPVPSRLAAG